MSLITYDQWKCTPPGFYDPDPPDDGPDAPCDCGAVHDEEEEAFNVCKACGRLL